MIRTASVALGLFAALAFVPVEAGAVTCANGVYRAGCAGPNGAVAVRKAPPPVYRAPVYRAPTTVTCVNGVYRAGCVRR